MSLDPFSPNILEWIRENYLDKVIQGEGENKLLIFLVCCSTFTKNPLSSVVKGPSGAGKSELVNRVLDIFRKLGIVIEFSRMTPTYLENLGRRDLPVKPSEPRMPRKRQEQSDEDFRRDLEGYRISLQAHEEHMKDYQEALKKPRSIDLRGKILFVDELRGIQNVQAPKLIISEKRLKLATVINSEATEIEVIGPFTIITTTTLAVLGDPELENRVLPIQIDETEEQTRAILRHEALGYLDPAQDLEKDQALEATVEFLKGLQPYGVANPYAARLAEVYPTKNIEARRGYPKLMNLSDSVTWLHQYQRQRATKLIDSFLVTHPNDIETVKQLALSSFREDISGISDKEQRILDYMKEQQEEDSFGNKTGTYKWVTISEAQGPLHKLIRKGEQWTRDHMDRLAGDGYFEKEEIPGKAKRYHYRFSSLQPESLDITEEAYRHDPKAVESWAETYGYKLREPPTLLEHKNKSPEQAKVSPLNQIEAQTYPNSEFGEVPQPAGEFGHVQAIKPDLFLSNQNTGIKCPRCNITWPDQPSFDNHLSTYKHD